MNDGSRLHPGGTGHAERDIAIPGDDQDRTRLSEDGEPFQCDRRGLCCPFSQDHKIHSVELFYTLGCPGYETLTCVYTNDADVVTGHWKDGPFRVVRGITDGERAYGTVVFGSKAVDLREKRLSRKEIDHGDQAITALCLQS